VTDAQIEILVRGIRNWAKPVEANPPAYASSRPGDPSRGHDVFAASCTSCHSKDGRGAMAVTDPSYLSAGHRSAFAHSDYNRDAATRYADWRNNNKTLSDADVTDLVAWLSSQRADLSAQLKH